MKDFIKNYWKTLLFFALVGLIELAAEGLDFLPVDVMMGVIAAYQAAGYGLVLGALGIFLSKKIGLWKDERRLAGKPLMAAVSVSVIGGLALILLDILFFGKYSQPIIDSYGVKPTVPYMLAAVLYGGVIEEVMLRLFWMSLVAFLLYKLFDRKHEKPTTAVLVVANVVAALLFAAGHLPATYLLMGLSPMIIFRCFLLNGGFGLAFGWLYRKYGLRYAMIAHAGCHVISKLIWIVFF